MRGIHVLYVVVALLSPHNAWSSPGRLWRDKTILSPGRLWRDKNKLKWFESECSSWDSSVHPLGDGDGIAQQCAADILSLMGGSDAHNSVKPSRAQELLRSIRFLVPGKAWINTPTRTHTQSQKRESHQQKPVKRTFEASERVTKEQIWKLVREPPVSVKELARKAVEYAGEPEAVLIELSSTLYKVPDIEGSHTDKCTLTKHDCAKRFLNKEINAYMAFLFEAIVALAPSAGLNVSLNRYDLFHGHMFTAHDTGRLGILFHSREYPEFDKKDFPLNLGYCQTGSFIPYDESMNLRNILWLAPMPSCTGHNCSNKWLAPGALFILDATPGGVIFKELVSEWVDVVRTIYESDFGRTVIDVNYFNIADAAAEERIFLT